jgi:hypothetical protein
MKNSYGDIDSPTQVRRIDNDKEETKMDSSLGRSFGDQSFIVKRDEIRIEN